MGNTYSVDQMVYNGVDYDKLNPTTSPNEIIGNIPVNKGGTGATTAAIALSNLGGSSQAYVDNTFLQKNNGVLTGQLNINNQRVVNAPSPVLDGDVVNKRYVDNSSRIARQGDTFSLYMTGGVLR